MRSVINNRLSQECLHLFSICFKLFTCHNMTYRLQCTACHRNRGNLDLFSKMYQKTSKIVWGAVGFPPHVLDTTCFVFFTCNKLVRTWDLLPSRHFGGFLVLFLDNDVPSFIGAYSRTFKALYNKWPLFRSAHGVRVLVSKLTSLGVLVVLWWAF